MDAGVVHACSAAGLVVPCFGDSGCGYSDGSCVVVASDYPKCIGTAGPPYMDRLANKIHGYKKRFHGVYNYMAGKFKNGHSCGHWEDKGWCVTVIRKGMKAFCAEKL